MNLALTLSILSGCKPEPQIEEVFYHDARFCEPTEATQLDNASQLFPAGLAPNNIDGYEFSEDVSYEITTSRIATSVEELLNDPSLVCGEPTQEAIDQGIIGERGYFDQDKNWVLISKTEFYNQGESFEYSSLQEDFTPELYQQVRLYAYLLSQATQNLPDVWTDDPLESEILRTDLINWSLPYINEEGQGTNSLAIHEFDARLIRLSTLLAHEFYHYVSFIGHDLRMKEIGVRLETLHQATDENGDNVFADEIKDLEAELQELQNDDEVVQYEFAFEEIISTNLSSLDLSSDQLNQVSVYEEQILDCFNPETDEPGTISTLFVRDYIKEEKLSECEEEFENGSSQNQYDDCTKSALDWSSQVQSAMSLDEDMKVSIATLSCTWSVTHDQKNELSLVTDYLPKVW
jgi:hypothetical protein